MATIAYKISTLNGTKALPAHTFDNDPDSGWYRQGAGAIRLSVDNTDVINATSSGITVPGTFVSTGLITASAGVLYGTTVTLTEGIANRLDLATGDSFNIVSGNLTVGGQFVATGTGPHAIGVAVDASNFLTIGGTTPVGTSVGIGFKGNFTLRPNVGDSAFCMFFRGTIQEAASGTHVDFASLRVDPPTITASGATITNATSVKITGAPTGGVTNRAFWVEAGLSEVQGLKVVGAIELDGDLNHDGSNIGFFAVAPVARAAAYTQTYSAADRTFSAYTADDESSAYTGAGDSEAKLADLNFLRIAVENLRAFSEDQAALINSLIDDAQAYGLAQ